MAKAKETQSTASPRRKLDSFEQMNAETEANTTYESGLIPLLWLAIPFVLLLIYGILS
jgi:hypothetical protein